MKDARAVSPYPLRMSAGLRNEASNEAHKNRRSLNTELGMLIEEALLARKQHEQNKQV
ncbi:Arc family DNA-binding protein [Pseudomonas helleri]|uniref:Arc family DNA-binding protein n=1 Tax=Pseudomonas helleri TaxID=1608996 RepID=UPI003FCFEB5F